MSPPLRKMSRRSSELFLRRTVRWASPRDTMRSWPELSRDVLLRGNGVSLLWRARLSVWSDPGCDCPRRLGSVGTWACDRAGGKAETSQLVVVPVVVEGPDISCTDEWSPRVVQVSRVEDSVVGSVYTGDVGGGSGGAQCA